MKLFAISVCIIGLLVNICISAPATTIQKTDEPNYRLPDAVEPLEYSIELTPYFDGEKAFTFDGIVLIDLKTNQSNVKQIILHKSVDMTITNTSIFKKMDVSKFAFRADALIDIKDTNYDNITNKLTIQLTNELEINTIYVLYFEYNGHLQNDMNGFYRSSYEEDGKTKWLAATHLEAVHARKVFPCFDEPRFKARFEIIINRPEHFRDSISNMPMETSWLVENDRVKEKFQKTPKMSTYLVAFIVSEFKCRENNDGDFQVCSRRNAYEQTKYSLEIGQQLLEKYDKLFDSKYSNQLPKMTMAAIPDYVSGATENWGLLTYREKSLLYESTIATSMAQQRVASVIAHEQSHMWFGDLVTCNWWSDLWLNEGFARFYEYFGTAMVEDKWGLEQQFVVDQVQNVFGSDSLVDSMPLSHDVSSPQEIAERFNSISYDKGASVIRMLQHTMGKDNFSIAIQKYLKKNAYESVVPMQLFDALQNEVNDELNIEAFMNAWVYKAGYPLVNVKLNNDNSITITQKRFLRNNMNHDNETLYSIPITYATNKFNTDFTNTQPLQNSHILNNDSMSIELDEHFDWIVLNVQQTGYYRVNYDDDLWKAINNVLHSSHSSIHVLNRAQIIDDALNLARAGYLDYEKVLNIVTYLRNEIDYLPWKAAIRNFDFILNRFKSDEVDIFQKFILILLNQAYEHVGFEQMENHSRLDIYNRVNILKYACQFGHEECMNYIRTEFDKIKNGKVQEVQNDIVPVIYCLAIANGTDDDWEFLWQKFLDGNVASEQATILESLGCAKSPKLIETYLNRILTDDIRLQDKHAALVSTFTYQENLDIVLDFVIKNHTQITKIFGSDSEVSTILTQILGRLTTLEQVQQVETFMEKNNSTSNKKLKTALENAILNLDWAEENIPKIKSFADNFVNSSATTNTISCLVLLSTILVYLLQ